jgi:hypothetical protein
VPHESVSITTGWKKPNAERPPNEAMIAPPNASRNAGGTSAESCENRPPRWRLRAMATSTIWNADSIAASPAIRNR